jgi:hypothetical protein
MQQCGSARTIAIFGSNVPGDQAAIFRDQFRESRKTIF